MNDSPYSLGPNQPLTMEQINILYRALSNDLKNRKLLRTDEEASNLLLEIQTILQRTATEEGIDVAVHPHGPAGSALIPPALFDLDHPIDERLQ